MASCRLSIALTKKKSQPASRVSGLPGYHANPTRRYQTLRSMKGAPNLPSGYASMLGLTYFPPLWRRVMDHRVLDHYAGDITRVNVHPRVRDKVFAKYGAGGGGGTRRAGGERGKHELLPLPRL